MTKRTLRARRLGVAGPRPGPGCRGASGPGVGLPPAAPPPQPPQGTNAVADATVGRAVAPAEVNVLGCRACATETAAMR